MSQFATYFWKRQPSIDAALCNHFAEFIGSGKLVVDIGPGYDPWPYATEFIDSQSWPQLAGKVVRCVDVEMDRLPYDDGAVDFIYCRHTIEDMHHPGPLMREMNRVAKAGYIETPSPAHEFCRGIVGDSRGHGHHRWFVWEKDGSLCLLPKYPIIESQPSIAGIDEELGPLLNAGPWGWNSYFAWRGSFTWRILTHLRDFNLHSLESYFTAIRDGIVDGIANGNQFLSTYDVDVSRFVGMSAAGVAREQQQRQDH